MKQPIPSIALFFVCLTLATACSNQPVNLTNDSVLAIDQTLKNTDTAQTKPAISSVPEEITQALLPPLNIKTELGNFTPLENRFDVIANNTQAHKVFMSLVEGTPYSMVVHPDVNEEISLQLKDVTVKDALEAIRQVYGYEYRQDGSRFMILAKGLQTRIFQINYLNLNRKGFSSLEVKANEFAQGTSSGSSSGAGIKVETQTNSHFWNELDSTLKSLVGNEGGRHVVVNPQAGIVIIKAFADELRIVEKFLNLTDAAVNRQVIIEAKVVEVELSDGFQSGINWASMRKTSDTKILAEQGGGSLPSTNGISGITGNPGNLITETFSPVNSTATSAFGGIFTLSAMSNDFGAFIELLQGQGSVHVLSSPRVSTINNQKAVIKVGGDEFFVTGISSLQTTTGSSTTSSPEVELTAFFSGIALDVTPQIDANGKIILHIHPSVSTISQRDKSFIIGGESFSLPLAFSSVQESDNIVRAQSGQVIIIGGLMKEGSSDESSSVPLLGDIPILGNLFKHRKITRIKKELVILLKPTVVENDTAWSDAIESSYDRVQSLQQARKQ